MGLLERRALARCEALIATDRFPDEVVIDFDIGSDLAQRVDLIVTNRALWLLKDHDRTLTRILYVAVRTMTWAPNTSGAPEGRGTWTLTVTQRDAAPVETVVFDDPRTSVRSALAQFDATLVDLGSRIVLALGPGGAGELLDALTRPEVDRANLVGRLSVRDDTTWLAELLIDIEVDEPIRLQVVDALRRALDSPT